MSLFNRVLRGRSPQPQVDPHSWKFPSSYSTPKPGAKQTVIPNPSIFGNAIIPDKPKTSNLESSLLYPDVSHAAVHLALLEMFLEPASKRSSLDVDVTKPPEYEEKAKTHSATPTKLLESQRWDLLISLAVTRFEVWWSKIDQVINHAMAYSHHSGKDVAVQLSKDQLPPLDVLMVWYALILNEDAYDRACTGNPRNQQLCFPWPAIRECIDMEKMQYSVPRSAQILFTTLSTQSSDILAYLEQPPAYMDSPPLSLEIDLAAQVKSNEDFITEAHSLLWIRAPSLRGSLDRASASYMEFQVQRGPTHMIKGHVPFGIHLIWRTHRLFPNFYKLFADEVEKISKREGVDGKAADSEKLAPASNAQMRICECWICERIRDDIPTYVSHQPGSSGSSGSPSQTSRDSPISSLSSSALKQIQDDIGFYEAVEAARRRGDSALPTRPPTAAEKAAEKILQDRQKAVGYRPGLHEYWEIQPDGTRKIKRQKNIHGYGTSGIWALGAMDI